MEQIMEEYGISIMLVLIGIAVIKALGSVSCVF